jgi:hypothetical protein
MSLGTKILTCTLICFSSNVFAAEFFGEAQIDAQMSMSPSSTRGHNAFSLSRIEAGARQPIWETADFVTIFRAAPDRDSVNGNYNLQAEEVRLSVRSLLGDGDELRYGLLVHPWVLLIDSYWGNRKISSFSSPLVSLYKYIPESDFGVSYSSLLGSFGRATLMLSNGEGAQSNEEALHKDGFLQLEFSMGQGLLAFGYVFGGYDGVDTELAKKERALALLAYRGERLTLAVEGFTGTDPVDKINLKVAGGVDLTALGGTQVKSSGASSFLRLQLTETKRWEALAYGTWINPASETEGAWVKSQLYGFAYRPHENLNISLLSEQSQYGDHHALGSRDRESYLIATQVYF